MTKWFLNSNKVKSGLEKKLNSPRINLSKNKMKLLES